MSSLIKCVVTSVGFILVAGAFSAQCATLEDAKALAEKAAALVMKDGENAFSTIQDPKGEFEKEDLYVVITDRSGIVRVHVNQKLLGVNMSDATDPDGVKFIKEQIGIGDTSGSGWTSYKYTNPQTKKIESKKVWVHRVGEFIVACGVYVP